MAHFAELDKDNKVLRIVVGCNQDIANNGGEQSQEAAEYFKKVCPFSENGVKWVQTSYNNNFRKQFASINGYYDDAKNKFILNQPYPSWTLDSNDDWQAPVTYPNSRYGGKPAKPVIPPLLFSTSFWKSNTPCAIIPSPRW